MLIPCIDVQGGRAVQLLHGRRRELAVEDVLGLLERFRRYRWVHVIDLEAAMGKPGNLRLVRELCRRAREEYGLKVRVGGGIRSVRRATEAMGWGAEQIIVGSAAFRGGKVDRRFLGRLRKRIGAGRVVVALDTERGRIVTHGWRRRLKLRAEDVMAELEPYCGGFLCTDVGREGTMSGADFERFRKLRSATRYPMIAAGGIRSHGEVKKLERMGMDAAVGMAIYKNRMGR
jgi:phosphoribosylformimino-5-aminoimidazole carboxamide ribotide isomerase